jgi:cobalt-zinc-cadmium efflux system protein
MCANHHHESEHSHEHHTTHKHTNHENHNHQHSHSHHDHSHHHHEVDNLKVLIISFLLTAIFMIVEFFGGIFSKSLALLSDSGHMFSDSVSLGIAIFATYWGTKKADLHKTFGYKRIETISAFINGITLVLVGLLLIKESFIRFFYPLEVNFNQMIIISSLGLLVNLIVAFILFKNSKENMNIKGAFLHVLGDLLGSVGAIVAGLIIMFTGWSYADPLISLAIAILILTSSFSILKISFNTLMEGAPSNIELKDVIKSLVDSQEQVINVHDVHIWSLNQKQVFLTAHIVIKEDSNIKTTLQSVKDFLHEKFEITHSTLEVEFVPCEVGCN